jgi:hypothetical protein
MIGANNRTLEQAPDVLQRVCVNDGAYVLFESD